jgi:hypothetical protein
MNLRSLYSKTVVCIATVFVFNTAAAQDSLDLIGNEPEPTNQKVEYSFKTSKVINLQSLELTGAGVFDFKINHRFGPINSGAYNAFGLDGAITRIGGEYGVIPDVMMGFGRSSYEKTLDAYVKYRIMHQRMDNSRPVSILLLTSVARRGMNFSFDVTGRQRLAFATQLIIGRKFSESFSLLLAPSIVHYNLTPSTTPNRQYALGIGLRQKLSKRTTLNLEYIPVLSEKGEFYNSISAGFDIETGGHVFQLHFTNSAANNEAGFIARNTGTWNGAGVRFGFNISRVFTIIDPSNFKNNNY